jgi:2-dehydro-3-deoxygluconokinase
MKYQEMTVPLKKKMKRYITFGEIMLRLKSPGHERFFQSPFLEATFGGGEANVEVKSLGEGGGSGRVQR